ncbi:MAG: hypothetical protein ACI9YL_000241 [Luteibaculaceae bacterium]|jgi:hypothetical protein
MNTLSKIFIALSLFLFSAEKMVGQTVYYMTDATVEACEGIIKDSEKARNGNDPTWYDHNEDYVFTICVPGTEQIQLAFTFFQLEDLQLDVLKIYDGPDINSPLIGTYTGLNSPGTINSTSDCLTLHFVSDASVAAPGWEAIWSAEPPQPIPPVFIAPGDVDCGTTQLQFTLDIAVACNKIDPANFSFSGPTGSISDVVPINCVNGKTNVIEVTFGSPLNESGTYNIVYSIFYTDICFNVYSFDIPITFDIRNCPLDIIIQGPTTVCLGECVILRAIPDGGDFLNYQYAWDNGLPATQNVQVCPTVNTTYTVTVSDGSSVPSTATHDVEVLTPPVAEDGYMLCWNDDPVVVTATPPGGTWSGNGVDATGNYTPDRTQIGINPLIYTASNGCTDTTFMDIQEGYAGWNWYACLGAAPFQLNGLPVGGTWSGQKIDAAGMFDPNALGSYIVTYTATTGCSDTATITVGNTLNVTAFDTTCVNSGLYQLTFDPPGGVWRGPGIQNGVLGRFNPQTAGIGSHELIYEAPDCADTTLMEVINVGAGPDTIACPSNGTFNLVGVPSGGVWTGKAVTGSSFDPGFMGGAEFNDTLLYTSNGCVAQRIVYVRNTRVSSDTLRICSYDNIFLLDPAVQQPFPSGGFWTGNGVVSGDRVNPAVLSEGNNQITYTANSCTANYNIWVNPKPIAQADTVVCLEGTAFTLRATPLGGAWFNHVEDPTGLFDPQVRGSGKWTAIYNLKGCLDTTFVTIQKVIAQITSIPEISCNTASPIPLSAQPSGGYFYVVRSAGDTVLLGSPQIIPSDLDSGKHELFYSYGTGECLIEDSLTFTVLDSIRINFPLHNDTICFGDETLFEFTVSGGKEDNGYTYDWEDPLKDQNPVYLTADETTYLTVSVSDGGCSADALDSLELFVHGEIWWVPIYGPKVCFGDSTYVKVEMGRATRKYFYEWTNREDTVIHTGDSLFSVADRYGIKMTDSITGCFLDKSVLFRHYPFLKADFTLNPEEICATIDDPLVQVIDISEGVQSGTWDFGDGSNRAWINQNNPVIIYQDTGLYEIELAVSNGDGLCTDTARLLACVNPIQTFFIENAFTPNGDRLNDFFPSGLYNLLGSYVPSGFLIEDYDLIILNRWGDEVYTTVGRAFKEPWNGKINNDGADAPNDMYRYGIRVYFENGTDALFREDKVYLIR